MMKKQLLSSIFALLIAATFAQAPQAFKFQTVIRDASGEVLPMQDVTLKFLLHQDEPSGDVIYEEQHITTTNAMGLVNLNIGSGEVLSGDFASLEWGDHQYFLEELIDVGNTDNFVLFGTVQLLSVPYALHANTAGNGIQAMTTEERDALEDPAVGMQIYNTTTNCLNYWSGSNWFETCGDCTPMPSNANAGPDQTYFDSTTVATLDGNIPEKGTGLWTKATSYPGWFEDPTDPTTTFHGEPCRSYYLKWTISTNCGSDYDYVKIIFDDTPSQAVAGADIIINSDTTSISLSAEVPTNGIGAWTVLTGEGGSFDDASIPAAIFTGADCESYTLLWEVATECNANTDTLNVDFYAIPTTANAGQDTTINDENLTINLGANTAEVGTGTWSIFSGEGGEFENVNDPNTAFTAEPCQTYELVWTIATACEASADTVVVDFFTLPTQADAGEDQLGLEGTWTNLEANTPEIGTGHWTIISGEGGQITNPNSPTTVFLGQNMMSYALEWQIATVCDTARDEVNIAFGFTPFYGCGDSLVDDRDGQKYATVQIGEQCWMAENLSIGERIDGAIGMTNNEVVEKYCYEDLEESCDVYGGLYQWNEMMQYTTTESVQGICPEGWHLPADAELCSLTTFLDASVNCLYGWSGDDVGGKLKEIGFSHWASPNEGADNSSGFTALPGGCNWQPDNSFIEIGTIGYWWSSTVNYTSYAWRWCVTYDSSNIQKFNSNKTFGFSVRCIKDNTLPPNQAPTSPLPINPQNGSSDQIININFSWSCTDPESDPLTYDVYFGTDATPTQVATGIADTFYTPGLLDYATTYYWQIVAHDDHGNATEGEVWSFSTMELAGDYSLEFNGTNTTVDIEYLEDFADNKSFTIETWIKPNDKPANVFTLGGNGHFFFGLDETNYFSFHIVFDSVGHQAGYRCKSLNPIEYQNWTNVAGVYDRDSNQLRLYIDGELSDLVQTPDFNIYHPNSDYSNIGSYYKPFYGGFYQGLIAGVHLSQDVKYLENFSPNYPIVSTENSIGLWLLNEGTGAIAHDFSGNENEGIIQNGGWSNDVPDVQYLPPDVPSNPIPENSSTYTSLDVVLSWSCSDSVNNPLTYDVYFGTESTPPQVATAIADTFYTPGTLEYATIYYWKIVAHDDQGNSAEGEVWSFTTIFDEPFMPMEGLSGWWPFNGNADDASGNGLNGVVHGTTLSVDRFGNEDEAYYFNGESNYIDLVNTFFNGNTNVTEVTYSVWVKINEYGDYIISGKEGFWRTIIFSIGDDGQFRLHGTSQNNYFGVNSIAEVPLNTWSNLVVTFDNGVESLYLNGSLVNSETTTVNSLDFSYYAAGNSTATNYIGAIHPVNPGITNYFKGYMDDFAIWGRVLTFDEIQGLFSGSKK